MLRRYVMWLMFSSLLVVCGVSFGEEASERTAQTTPNRADSRPAWVDFGVPFTDLPGPDLSDLPEKYQVLCRNIMRLDPRKRPPTALCFAPGTDPKVVERVTQLLYYSPADFQLGSRWSTTANGGTGGQGDPITITYSFALDP